MQRCLWSLCLLVPILGAVQAQEQKKPVEILWHGQSFFEVRSSQGTRIIFDPHLIEAYGRPQGIKADLVLISHPHPDHAQVEALENPQQAKIIPGVKGTGFRTTWNDVNTTFKDVKIRSLGVYHDNAQGMKYGKNTIFMIEVDGWKIVHLGDLGHQLTPKQIKDIGSVDVLMVPVGGIYTLNGTEAKKVVQQLQPKEYIFPMHYATPVFQDVLDAEEFLENFPPREVARPDSNRVVLNRDPNRPRPLVVVPHYWPKKKENGQ